jgi:peptidoglycan hydrolase CwlO-like protein
MHAKYKLMVGPKRRLRKKLDALNQKIGELATQEKEVQKKIDRSSRPSGIDNP